MASQHGGARKCSVEGCFNTARGCQTVCGKHLEDEFQVRKPREDAGTHTPRTRGVVSQAVLPVVFRHSVAPSLTPLCLPAVTDGVPAPPAGPARAVAARGPLHGPAAHRQPRLGPRRRGRTGQLQLQLQLQLPHAALRPPPGEADPLRVRSDAEACQKCRRRLM